MHSQSQAELQDNSKPPVLSHLAFFPSVLSNQQPLAHPSIPDFAVHRELYPRISAPVSAAHFNLSGLCPHAVVQDHLPLLP